MPKSAPSPKDNEISILLSSDYNVLASLLLTKLHTIGCKVFIDTKDISKWEKYIDANGIKDVKVLKKKIQQAMQIKYVIAIDIDKHAINGCDYLKRFTRIRELSDYANKYSSKILYVFSYLQTKSYKNQNIKLVKWIKENSNTFSLVFLGQLFDFYSFGRRVKSIDRMLGDFCFKKQILVPSTNLGLFPVNSDLVCEKLIRHLFSFSGNFSAIISSGWDVAKFCKYFAQNKATVLKVKQVNKYFKARVDEKIIINFDIDMALMRIKKEYRSIPKQDQGNMIMSNLLQKRMADFKTESAFSKLQLSKRRRRTELLQKAQPSEIKPSSIYGSTLSITQNKPKNARDFWRSIRKYPNTTCRAFWKVPKKQIIDFYKKFFFLLFFVLATPFLTLAVGLIIVNASNKATLNRNFIKVKKYYSLADPLIVFSESSASILSKLPLLGRLYKLEYELARVANKTIYVQEGYLSFNEKLFSYYSGLDKQYSRQRISLNDLSIESDFLTREYAFLIKDKDVLLKFSNKIITLLLSELVKLPFNQESNFQSLINAFSIFEENNETNILVLILDENNLRPGGGAVEILGTISFSKGKREQVNIYFPEEIDEKITGIVEPPVQMTKYLKSEEWKFQDYNWDSDFAVSSDKAKWFLEKAIDTQIDGVIAINKESYRELSNVLGLDVETEIFGEVSSETFQSTGKKEVVRESVKQFVEELFRLDVYKYQKLSSLLKVHLMEKDLQFILNDIKSPQDTKNLCSSRCFSDVVQIVETNLGNTKSVVNRNATIEVTLEEGLVKRRLEYQINNESELIPYETYLKVLAPTNSGFGVYTVFQNNSSRKYIPEMETGDTKKAGLYVEVAPEENVTISLEWESGLSKKQKKISEYQLVWLKQSGVKEMPVDITIKHPKTISSSNLSFALTEDGLFRYNTSLNRDVVSRVVWKND